MRIPKRNPKHDDAFANRPDLTQILHFRPPVPIAPPPQNPNVAGPSLVASPQMPTPILRKKEKRQLTISDTSDSDNSSERKSKRTIKIPKKSSTSIVEKNQNTEGVGAELKE